MCRIFVYEGLIDVFSLGLWKDGFMCVILSIWNTGLCCLS